MKRKVLLTVIPSNEYYRLKEGIKLYQSRKYSDALAFFLALPPDSFVARRIMAIAGYPL